MVRWLFPEQLGGMRAVALLLVRLAAGTGMMLHGWPKIQSPTSWMGPEAPVPGALQALAALAEFGGGVCWIFGFFTPIASILILGTMVVAVGMVHIGSGHPFVASTPGSPSYELGLLYLVLSLLLLVVGPGKLSIDALAFPHLPSDTPQPALA